MKTFFDLAFLLTVFLITITAQEKRLILPAVFSDNMVLQQNSNAAIWGKADAGSKILIESSWGKSAETVADKYGKWKTEIQTPPAGGPFELKIKTDKEEITYKNVLIGEVWLCSGQSNMEMTLEGFAPNSFIEGSKEVIANSQNSNIRFFTVAREISSEPNYDCKGQWQESTPQTAAKFSATAYFFGKKLYDELNVPIGLIHSSWGGTPAEAWTSGKYLEDFPVYKETITKLPQSAKEINTLKNWLYELPQINLNNEDDAAKWQSIDFNDSQCSSPEFKDNVWPEMNLPVLWEAAGLGNFDGAVWFRKKIELPQTFVNNDLVLELGPIDDMDITFVNGVEVGGFENEGFWNTNRIYNIPKELIKNNIVTIAVRVIDNQGGGGIYGKKEQILIRTKDGTESVSIAGVWKYLPVAEFENMKFFVFGAEGEKYKQRPKLTVEFSSHTPSTLYNGMIAPLIPYNIKGAIWYQGESNVGRAEEYKELFPAMIKNWREDWGLGDFPFYYVQIAPWNYGKESHSELLREAQMMSLSVPNTGMAVTLDIGNPEDIHPAKKFEVGNRLALWALAKNYGKDIPFSGPMYASFQIENEKIILSFKYAESGLVINEINNSNNFVIAGNDMVFKKAEVKVEGNKLIVYNTEIKNPAVVRYCWDNISEATLFNKDGLPASSFRTDN